MNGADERRGGGSSESSRDLIRQFIEHTPAAVAMFDRDMRYLLTSRQFLADYGLQEQDVIGRSHYEIFPDIPERWKDIHRRCLAGAVETADEDPFPRADGSLDWVRWEIRPWREPDGAIGGIILFSMVITAQKRARDELREIGTRFQATFEQAAVGIAHVAPDGTFLRVNRRLCDLVGYTREEMRRLTFQQLTHPDDRDEDVGNSHEMLAGRLDTYEKEKRYLRKDGGEVWVNLTVSLVRRDDGEPDYFISVIEDISARKAAEEARARLESQLQQSQKMEAIGRLAGGVAHDFNNMLSVIIGNLDLAREKLPEDHPALQNLAPALRAASRSADLAGQLLTFARRQPVNPRVLDLDEVVEGSLRLLRRVIGETVVLDWRRSGAKLLVRMDPVQIDQILTNLAVNARDAMSGAGAITIRTDARRLTAPLQRYGVTAEPGDFAVLTFADDGVGMDAELRKVAFEPYFTTKSERRGTGLGLATVLGVVQQNGGFIDVESAPGEGTLFTIGLPRLPSDAPAGVRPAPETAPPARGETVLLVEDEPDVLDVGRAMLESLGYTVLATHQPQEALEILGHDEVHIDILVTDVVMPGMSGAELAENVRRLRPEVACLFVSGYAGEVLARHGVRGEDVQLLTKPFSRADLAVRLREILDS